MFAPRSPLRNNLKNVHSSIQAPLPDRQAGGLGAQTFEKGRARFTELFPFASLSDCGMERTSDLRVGEYSRLGV